MGDVVNVYDGIHQTPTYTDNGIMFLSVENISTLKSEKYISEAAFNRDYKVYPEKGDVLMTRIGDVGTPNIVETTEKLAFYVSLALLKPINVDSYFLCNSILSQFFQAGLKKRTLVTAIPQKINKDEIGKVGLYLPISFDEQRKIGAIFQSINNLITIHQRKIDSIKKYKRGLLSAIFERRIRFKADDGSEFPEWEEVSLEDVASGFEYGMGAASTEYDGLHKYIRITDIDDDTHKYQKDILVSPSGQIDDNYRVKCNDILFARTGASTGKSYLYDPADGNLYFAGFLIRIHVHDCHDSYFIYLITLTYQYRKWVFIESTRSGQPGINAEQYRKYKFLCPSYEEQLKIACLFSTLDKKLIVEERKLESLKTLKQGLLQQLFI